MNAYFYLALEGFPSIRYGSTVTFRSVSNWSSGHEELGMWVRLQLCH